MDAKDDRRALLQSALEAVETMQAKLAAAEHARTEPIAIVGLGCRLPGAEDPTALWRLLRDGVDAVREVPRDRWDPETLDAAALDDRGRAAARLGGFLERVDLFDPAFFAISPREAVTLDPQQRLLLEVTWEALEDAAQAPDRLHGSTTGVFVGITTSEYAKLVGVGEGDQTDVYAATGNALNAAAGRLAFVLGLHGPCMAVDTACSSSLTAIHLACQSLRAGECDLALAGGVNVVLSPDAALLFARWGMLAADGRCKTFDAAADGFVRSEGCGVIVLKRLSAALAAGDRVRAVILGSAVNQDGASSGLTVPNGPAQQAVIRRALAVARLQPHEVDYVEAHGTGTPLGDPIEVEALAAVMAPQRPADRPLAIGSIKTNIGHPEAASGVAGLLKVVLALEHEAIPPHLHFRERSPRIPWPGDAIYVPARLTPWPRGERRRIAGVSSFGFSGTNAHVIVAEPPVPPVPVSATTADRPWHLVTVSGRTDAALKAAAEGLAAHLASVPDLILPDLGYTRNAGRSHLAHRAAVIAKDTAEARGRLLAVASGAEAAGVRRGVVQPGQRPRVAWLFTGQGSQYAGMGRELYQTQPVFRRALERCDAALRVRLERPLLDVLFATPESAALLDETAHTQPALFALEWALAELWRAWGVVPAAVMGHSVGEIAAAAVAGVLTPEDGAILAAERGRLMQGCRRGAMTAVFAGEERALALLTSFRGALSLAAVNGPESTVVSGEPDAMVAFRAACDADGIRSKPLTVSHAFHSPMMEPMLDALEECARGFAHADPQVELISNLTGDAAKPGDVGPAYWRRHAREAVRFDASMRALRDRGCDLFLEIGPQPTLLGMGRRCVEGGVWLPSLRPGQPEWSTLLESLAELYTHGAPIDWAAFDAEWPRRKLPLPSYPFQRSRHWVDADARSGSARRVGGRAAGEHPFLQSRTELADGSGTQVFQGEIGIPLFPYLRDHRVQQGAVVPATAWTEMVLGAFTTAYGPGPVIVEGIEYQKPLFLTDDARHGIQVILKPSAAGVGFTIGSRRVDDAAGGPGWTQHVAGRMRRGEPADGRRRPDVVELGARCPDEVTGTDFYPLLRERGNDWGPMFQGVERLWRSAGEAWSVVRVPPALESEVGSYQCHPAVADAAGHVLTATVAMRRSSGPRGGAFVGGGIEEIRVYRPLRGGRVWSHARLRESADLAGNVLVGDVEVFDEAGELISEARGARLWYLDADAPPARRPDVGDWFFGIDWVPLPLPQASGSATPGSAVEAGRWIVVAPPGAALAESLGKTLAARGGAVHFVSAQPDDLQARLDGILTASSQSSRGVVYLAIHDDDSVVSGAKNAGEASGCAQALEIVRALRAAQTEETPRLWLVTCGAQAVAGANVTDALAGALWGLGRSLAVEHLEMWGGLVDLDPDANAGASAARIVEELFGPRGDDQVAFRGETRWVPRLARLRPPAPAPAPLRADASYLVTGGFGGLGIAVARALVQRGARHVVLMARTELPARASWRDLPNGPRARAAAAVREIESLGASVLPAAVDIADPDALSAWLDGFRAEGRPPIRGVVHLAGVLAHRALHEETAEGLEAALRPKVLGALSLHRLFKGENLDFFVLFSSAAAVLSSPLLGSYAAANAFLDALAHYRRGHGLPALSVSWGLWGETGMATRFQAEDVSALSQRGMGTIRTGEGIEALWRLMDSDVTHAAVLPVDWAEWTLRYPAFAEAPFLSKVVAGAALRDGNGANAGDNRGAAREAILAAPSGERKHLIQVFVTEQVAQVMRVGNGDLDPQQPLRTLGLDSLMAVEIRNRIEAGLGVAMPLVSLLEGPSIETVAEHVGAHLSEARSLIHSGPDVGDAVRAAHLLERMDDLSDAEVHALLEQILPRSDVA